MISGPYYRLHCDGEKCSQVEDFDVSELLHVPALSQARSRENELRFARLLAVKAGGWSLAPQLSEIEYPPEDAPVLCPKCTQKEADR